MGDSDQKKMDVITKKKKNPHSFIDSFKNKYRRYIDPSWIEIEKRRETKLCQFTVTHGVKKI